MQDLLEVKDLTVNFEMEGERKPALHGISFSLKRGEILAIVGESGSGKSVTSLSILQLLPQPNTRYSTGEIIFSHDGISAMNLMKASRKQLEDLRGNSISMIFQEPMSSLNPVFTCGDQVREAILRHKKISKSEARKQVELLFKKVKLPEPGRIYNSYPHQLSGGQKQRVMIAMAVSCQPSLLIADEPTTALDVTVQRTILDLIRDLQRAENMGVIFISHDLGVVAGIADRILVMYKGRIVEEGPTKRIMENPKNPYTKALLACRPILHSKGERLPVVEDFMESERNQKAAELKVETTVPAIPVDPKPFLIVDDLSVWFPGHRNWLGKTHSYTKAVDGVSFEVLKRETLGLVGESGCGKSTLGRALLRLVNPTRGRVLLGGKDLGTLSSNQLGSSGRISRLFSRTLIHPSIRGSGLATRSLSQCRFMGWNPIPG